MEVNTILYTKDGRKIGNAIVTMIKGSLFQITTDYGNKVILSAPEIEELFYIERYEDSDHGLIKHKHFVS